MWRACLHSCYVSLLLESAVFCCLHFHVILAELGCELHKHIFPTISVCVVLGVDDYKYLWLLWKRYFKKSQWSTCKSEQVFCVPKLRKCIIKWWNDPWLILQAHLHYLSSQLWVCKMDSPPTSPLLCLSWFHSCSCMFLRNLQSRYIMIISAIRKVK